jgi:hypothetical protein
MYPVLNSCPIWAVTVTFYTLSLTRQSLMGTAFKEEVIQLTLGHWMSTILDKTGSSESCGNGKIFFEIGS